MQRGGCVRYYYRLQGPQLPYQQDGRVNQGRCEPSFVNALLRRRLQQFLNSISNDPLRHQGQGGTEAVCVTASCVRRIPQGPSRHTAEKAQGPRDSLLITLPRSKHVNIDTTENNKNTPTPPEARKLLQKGCKTFSHEKVHIQIITSRNHEVGHCLGCVDYGAATCSSRR